MLHNFYKTRTIYYISEHIADRRLSLLKDLVAYTNDPVRYKRRFRILVQLANYEKNILEKIENFITDQQSDIDIDMLDYLKLEVDAIVNLNS